MKIVLLFGGSSSERFVSYNSAKAIYTALKQTHEVICIDPAMGNDTFDFENVDFITYQTLAYKKPNEIDSVEYLFNCIKHIKYNIKPDFVFLGLHGGYGEDGFLQDCLNRFSLKYSGSSELPSKLAMNKHMSKQIMLSANVATAKWLISKTILANPLDLLQTLNLPVVVKPNSGGSSVALTIVKELS
jgi:D-alanine-D-alanine ligase